MRWSFQIARVGGTSVQIHLTFLLLLGWLAGTYYLQGGPQAAIDGTIFILSIFGCVLLHEFGHAIAARRYGIPTPTITLLPIGGVAQLQRMPDEPREELVVAIAGPLVNVAIAGAIWLFLGPSADVGALARIDEQQIGLLHKLFAINVFLVVFNLVPAFPMDGGRILRAILAMRLPYGSATRIAATVGQGLAFVFGFLGLFGNPLLLLIALFVYLGASQEAAVVEMRETTRGVTVGEAMLANVPRLSGGETAEQTARQLLDAGREALPVVEDGELRGLVFRADVFRTVQKGDPEATAGSLVREGVPSVDANEALHEALQTMQSGGHSVVPVLEEGELVGLLSFSSIGDMLMLRPKAKGAES